MNLTCKFIFDQIRQYKYDILIGSLLLIITNIIGIYIPIRLKDIIDNAVVNGLAWDNKYYIDIAVLIILIIVMALVRILSRVYIFGVGRKVESDQKQLFYNHLLSLDFLYFSQQRIGDLITRATHDIQILRQMMGFGLLNIINIIWVCLLVLPMMFKLNAQLTIWLLLGYIPILFFAKYISNRLKTLQIKHQDELSNLSSFIEESLNGIEVIKSYIQEKRELNKFNIINKNYQSVSIDLGKIRSYVWPILGMTRTMSYVIVVIFLINHEVSIGTVTAFLLYLERLAFPTAIMGWLITIFQKGSVGITRINEVLNNQSQIYNEQANIQLNRPINININNLNFKYNDNKVLDNITMNIAQNNFVGIVGRIGSGKSTLINSLSKLYKINNNSININNHDINNIQQKSLNQHIVHVPQSTYLFSASIIDNLTLFNDNINISRIKEILEFCCILDEINNLPQQLHTIIGEKGQTLSGGQIQRLTLARALLQNPSVLILDQALSSIDNQTSNNIINNIHAMKDISIIFVTHKVSLLQEAHNIYVLKDGQIYSHGKYQELLNSCSEFHQLSLVEEI